MCALFSNSLTNYPNSVSNYVTDKEVPYSTAVFCRRHWTSCSLSLYFNNIICPNWIFLYHYLQIDIQYIPDTTVEAFNFEHRYSELERLLY